MNDIRAEIEQNFQKMTDEKTLSVQQMIENNIYQAVQNSSQEIGQILENRIEELDKKIQAEAIGRQEEIRKIIEEMHRQIATRIATDVEQKTQELEKLAHAADQRSQEAITLIQSTNNTAQQAINQLQAVYSSNSWRITAPLRKLKETFKFILKRSLIWLMALVLKNSTLTDLLIILISRYPKLLAHLRLFAINYGLVKKINKKINNELPNVKNKIFNIDNIGADITNKLTPKALEIYIELKNGIEERKSYAHRD